MKNLPGSGVLVARLFAGIYHHPRHDSDGHLGYISTARQGKAMTAARGSLTEILPVGARRYGQATKPNPF